MRPLTFMSPRASAWLTKALLIAMVACAPVLTPSAALAQDDFDDESFSAGDQYYNRATRYVRFRGFSKAMKLFKQALPYMNEESDIY